MHRTRWAVGLLALGLMAGACDGKSKSPSNATATSTTTSTSVVTTTTSTASAPTTTEPTTDLPDSDTSGKSELADGRHFGYWSTFEIGDTIAFGEFDLAVFLTGKEAEDAAKKKGDTVENDYYIVNDNPKLRTLIANGDTDVRVLTDGSATLHKSNVADFAVDRHKQAGFWVTITNGIVTKIEEQYQP